MSKQIITESDFDNSEFCQTYQCREEDSWSLQSGGMNHTYETILNSTPNNEISIEIQTDGTLVTGFGLMFIGKDRLMDDDFKVIECLLRSMNQNGNHKKAMIFIRKHIENHVYQIKQAPSYKDGDFEIWAGKVIEQIISIERIKS